MDAGTGVFVLTEASALVPMQVASFASEDDFQELLARFPALLAGDQMDSANPRRFMLVEREKAIASEPGGAARSSTGLSRSCAGASSFAVRRLARTWPKSCAMSLASIPIAIRSGQE